jgi:hypothetical protein
VTQPPEERQHPDGSETEAQRDPPSTHPTADDPDAPEFRDYRPNFSGAESYRGPQPGDRRNATADDPDSPEFRDYRPHLGGRDTAYRDQMAAQRRQDDGPREQGWPDERSRHGDQDEEWRRPGRFTGYGPRGYQRADERIREDVCERLTYYGELDAREIDVEVKDGEVTLTGTVEDRAAKRVAERIAESISGVNDVHNRLQLRAHTFRRG